MSAALRVVRRALRVASRAAAITLVFTLALLLGVVAHLDLPRTRRAVIAVLDPVLAKPLRGKIQILRIGHLGLGGVSGVDARVVDEDGVVILDAKGIRARTSVIALGLRAARGKDLRIEVDEVGVDSAEVDVDTREDGKTRLEVAFRPRTPAPEGPPSRAILVTLAAVGAKHVWVHGTLAGLPSLDVDLADVRGDVAVAPGATRLAVDHAGILARGMPRGANPIGSARAELAIPSPAGHTLGLAASFHGAVGGVPAVAACALDGGLLRGVVDVPRGSSAAVRAMVPEAPLAGAVSARIVVTGELPTLHALARVGLEDGTVDVQGPVTLSARPSGQLLVSATSVDERAFSLGGPRFLASAGSLVSFAVLPDGAVGGGFDLDLTSGSVDGERAPPSRLHGDYAVGPGGATVHAAGRVEEDGAPADVTIEVTPDAGSHALELDARALVARLEATRIGAAVHGRASVHAHGRLRLADRSLDASAELDVDDVVTDGARVGHAHVDARARGSAKAPSLDARVTAGEIALGPLAYATGAITAEGPLDALAVALALDGARGPRTRPFREPHLEARAVVQARGGLAVRNARASATRDDVRADVRVREVRLDGGALVVEDAVIEGVGDPLQVSLRRTPARIEARAASRGVDLGRIGHVLALPDVRSGRLAVDADLVVGERSATGKLALDAVGVSVERARDLTAHVDASFTGRKAVVHVNAEQAGVGSIEITEADLELAGDRPFSGRSWLDLLGVAKVGARVDAAKLAELFPAAVPPGVAGAFVVDAEITRAVVEEAPRGRVTAQAKDLALGEGVPAPAGLDVELVATLDGRTSTLDLRAADRTGDLVAVEARSGAMPPFLRLMADPVLELKTVPSSVTITVPRRSLATLPLPILGVTGEIDAVVTATGTAVEPVVRVDAHAFDLRSPEHFANAVEVDLEGRYAKGKTELLAKARAPKYEVLRAYAEVHARAADAIVLGRATPWDADARATLERFPLGAVAALSEHQIRGRLTGEVAVTGIHRDARARADLHTENLVIGETKVPSTKIAAYLHDRAAHASVRVEHPGGAAEASGDVGLAWGAALEPRVDHTIPAAFALEAARFPASLLAPFAAPTVGDLDGRIDANVRVAATPGAAPRAEGFVTMTDGVAEVTALGERFEHIGAKLTVTPAGVVRLEDFSATGATGLVTASALARLDGRRLLGAEAHVNIPSSKPLPLVSQGVQLGDVYGDFSITAAPAADLRETDVTVDVPTMHVRLSPTSLHAVQSLDDAEKIRIGVLHPTPAGADRRFRPISLDERPPDRGPVAMPASMGVNVTIRLGKDVLIERGRTTRVELEGAPRIHLSDAAHASGQIRIVRGSVEVQDKRFEIEKGVVTFVDDPANPGVVLTAVWPAPDGTRVFVDFTGPLKTGKVTLRSDPSRSQDEIFQLIVFGAVEGSSTTPYAEKKAGTGTRAGAAAGGLATEGLNKGLERLTGLDVATKIDTNSGPNPRPEVELRIARDISLQIAFVLGTPPPGASPDRTYATIDWRFLGSWSLATTFGDQGTSIADIVWRHRY